MSNRISDHSSAAKADLLPGAVARGPASPFAWVDMWEAAGRKYLSKAWRVAADDGPAAAVEWVGRAKRCANKAEAAIARVRAGAQ